MNPTSNKSDFEDLTTNLKDLAYSYLEKYNPSKQQLKIYLLKKYLTKIKGTKSKKEVTSIIDEIVVNLEKNKIDYLDKPYTRFDGKAEQQETFFIKDPHGNILELKTLKNSH